MLDLKNKILTYYTACFEKDRVVIRTNTRNIYKNDKIDLLIKDKYLTTEEARNAINEVLPRAKEHFKECLQAYRDITHQLKFSKGFHYEGDSYGIYNEYDYISFDMNGFSFQFEIDE